MCIAPQCLSELAFALSLCGCVPAHRTCSLLYACTQDVQLFRRITPDVAGGGAGPRAGARGATAAHLPAPRDD